MVLSQWDLLVEVLRRGHTNECRPEGVVKGDCHVLLQIWGRDVESEVNGPWGGHRAYDCGLTPKMTAWAQGRTMPNFPSVLPNVRAA